MAVHLHDPFISVEHLFRLRVTTVPWYAGSEPEHFPARLLPLSVAGGRGKGWGEG